MESHHVVRSYSRSTLARNSSCPATNGDNKLQRMVKRSTVQISPVLWWIPTSRSQAPHLPLNLSAASFQVPLRVLFSLPHIPRKLQLPQHSSSFLILRELPFQRSVQRSRLSLPRQLSLSLFFLESIQDVSLELSFLLGESRA